MKSVKVFAPASVANVGVGFDILGFAFDGLGDQVQVERLDDLRASMPTVIIEEIPSNIPKDIEKNTATVGLLQMIKDLNLKFGFKISISKGIPMSSGMGGSAASAVAAVFAANELLDKPLGRIDLLKYALAGEQVASGTLHCDNIVPCLFGGLQLVQSLDPFRSVSIPIPLGIKCVIVHPHAELETKTARKILKKEIPLADHVAQSASLAGFISSCYTSDIDLLKASFNDLIIEPQRSPLIQGFNEVKRAALEAGAIGCAISGSGPSLFAWAKNSDQGNGIKKAMMEKFGKVGINSDGWVGNISATGARRVE